MAVTANDLRSFHEFAASRLSNGGADLTMEDLLHEWREREEVNAAIRAGLADVEAGRYRPAEEVMRELREKHGIPAR